MNIYQTTPTRISSFTSPLLTLLDCTTLPFLAPLRDATTAPLSGAPSIVFQPHSLSTTFSISQLAACSGRPAPLQRSHRLPLSQDTPTCKSRIHSGPIYIHVSTPCGLFVHGCLGALPTGVPLCPLRVHQRYQPAQRPRHLPHTQLHRRRPRRIALPPLCRRDLDMKAGYAGMIWMRLITA